MDLFETAISQGIAPAIVVAIYLIIIKIIDTKKEIIKIHSAYIPKASELIHTIRERIKTVKKLK